MKRLRQRQPKVVESYIMVHGEAGDHFYTDKSDKDMTVYSVNWKRKIHTEKLLLVKPGKEPEIKVITKVTLGERIR